MPEGDGPRVLMAVQQLRRQVPGGIGNYARGLLKGLRACAEAGQDVDLTLLASRPPGRCRRDPLADFDRPIIASPLPGPALTRLWDRGLWRLPPGFDVVHSVSLAFPPIRPSVHSVVTVHDVAWRRFPHATTPRGARWHEAALCRARDSQAFMVVPSRFVAADLYADGIDERRITVIKGGSDHLVPADQPATDEELARLGVTGPFLLTVSTLEPRKNVDRLLAAYRALRLSLPEPWPLLIVGPTGWGPQLLPSPEEQAGVILVGAVPGPVLTGLYQRAGAFAYVPLTEGYGLPPLEAMRLGTPTMVSTQVPSVRDLGETGQAPAIVVDPLDVDAIAAGLFTVMTDEAVRADLSARGTVHATARTWRSVAEQHRALWRSLT
jgi:glycosyltransferase involved in cell wall biosynthesis